jgi:hypothetical protein
MLGLHSLTPGYGGVVVRVWSYIAWPDLMGIISLRVQFDNVTIKIRPWIYTCKKKLYIIKS